MCIHLSSTNVTIEEPSYPLYSLYISIVDQLVLAPRNVAAATCFTALAETTTESGRCRRQGTVQHSTASTAQYSCTVQEEEEGAGLPTDH